MCGGIDSLLRRGGSRVGANFGVCPISEDGIFLRPDRYPDNLQIIILLRLKTLPFIIFHFQSHQPSFLSFRSSIIRLCLCCRGRRGSATSSLRIGLILISSPLTRLSCLRPFLSRIFLIKKYLRCKVNGPKEKQPHINRRSDRKKERKEKVGGWGVFTKRRFQRQ